MLKLRFDVLSSWVYRYPFYLNLKAPPSLTAVPVPIWRLPFHSPSFSTQGDGGLPPHPPPSQQPPGPGSICSPVLDQLLPAAAGGAQVQVGDAHSGAGGGRGGLLHRSGL